MSGLGHLNEHLTPKRRSIRVRLLLLALLPLAVVLPVLLAVLALVPAWDDVRALLPGQGD